MDALYFDRPIIFSVDVDTRMARIKTIARWLIHLHDSISFWNVTDSLCSQGVVSPLGDTSCIRSGNILMMFRLFSSRLDARDRSGLDTSTVLFSLGGEEINMAVAT
jgi:hypothetical protein